MSDPDERQRQARLTNLAFDMASERFGQADWQRARREQPERFWEAKVRIQTELEGMRLVVDRRMGEALVFRFDWMRNGQRERIDHSILIHLLDDNWTYGAPDMALKHALDVVAWEIRRFTGAPTSLSVRSNREAHQEMLRRENQDVR